MAQKTLEKLAPVLSTHSGREKCVRILQYSMMFLVPTVQNMKDRSK